MPRSLGLYGDGVSFWVVSGRSSCLARIWSDSGPSWWQAHLLAKMDSSAKDSGRLVGCPFGPSQILLVSFCWQRRVLYWDILLWDNSGKQFSCLTKAGNFDQPFANRAFLRSHSWWQAILDTKPWRTEGKSRMKKEWGKCYRVAEQHFLEILIF